MAVGFGTPPGLGALASAAGDIVGAVLGDVLGTLLGEDRFRALFKQDESGDAGIRQYIDAASDRSKWRGPVDLSVPVYFFLLKYKGITLEIPFNVNPEREVINEPNACTIVLGQGGGKIIESEGMPSKDITISGRTGLYPGERRLRLPDSGIGSGFEAFKFLETVIRRYCFLRRYGDLSEPIYLVYVNRRRQEAWLVEPKSFQSQEATEHNFQFSYSIQLETLTPYDGQDSKGLAERLLSAIPFFNEVDGILQRASEAVDQLNAAAAKVSAIVDGFSSTIMSRVVALVNTFADVKSGRLPAFKNFKRDALKGLLRDLRAVHSALEIAGDKKNAAKVAKVERRLKDFLKVDQAYNQSNQDNAKTTSAKQNAQTNTYTDAKGNPVSQAEAATAGATPTPPNADKVFSETNKDGGTIGETDATSAPNAGDAPITADANNTPAPNPTPGSYTAQAKAAAESSDSTGAETSDTASTVGGGSLDPAGGSSTFSASKPESKPIDPALLVPPSSDAAVSQLNWQGSMNETLANIDPSKADFKAATISVGDDIKTLASKLLGDPGRFTELILLNNLKAPYIATKEYIEENNLTNVLAYGDTVLFSTPKQTAGSKPDRVWRNETDQSLALSSLERAFGADVMMDEASGDIAWTSNDLALAYGIENLGQFIRFRATLQKGLFRRASRLGFSKVIGFSAGVSEAVIKAEARGLFKDDERISSCEAIDVKRIGQALSITLLIRVKNRQDPIIQTVQAVA